MSGPVTVVISSAGLGTRLGVNTPKALAEIEGKPIVQHQLEMLHSVDDVVVVVGYMAKEVIQAVLSVRPSAAIALNHQFASTGTAASLQIGSRIASDMVVSLDGDLLVRPDDFYRLLSAPDSCLGITGTVSKDPVCAELSDDGLHVTSLSQDRHTPWEWSGLAKVPRESILGFDTGHVFPGLLPSLPMRFLEVDTVEVDYPEDLETAEAWLLGRNRGKANGAR